MQFDWHLLRRRSSTPCHCQCWCWHLAIAAALKMKSEPWYSYYLQKWVKGKSMNFRSVVSVEPKSKEPYNNSSKNDCDC